VIFTAIKRYLIILVAYLLAVAVTSLGVGVVMLFIDHSRTPFLPFLQLCGFVFAFVSILASAPAAVVVGVGEWRAWTALWFYACVGVLTGLVLGSLFRIEMWFPIAGVVLGAVAGSVYWAVAGRNAGVLKTPETARAQTHLLLLLGTSVVITVAVILAFVL
jgi:hypothetical protein